LLGLFFGGIFGVLVTTLITLFCQNHHFERAFLSFFPARGVIIWARGDSFGGHLTCVDLLLLYEKGVQEN
jgi:hypothetical protein